MIPGGFSPTDRPMAERELPTGTPRDRRRSSAKAVWLTLALIMLAIAAAVMLLSLMPDA